MVPIAHIRNDFNTKFGIPRQSGLIEEIESLVVFDAPYNVPEALRGLKGFSHIWLLWDFSESHCDGWSPTVRPPRLGGNQRMGVFATRSPFRPNPIGLSAVKLSGIDWDTPHGPVLRVLGADLMDGTPIWDIKPYLPLTDCHPDATSGFAQQTANIAPLEVEVPENIADDFTPQQASALRQILSSDPRPHYQHDENRIYGFSFAGREIKFKVKGEKLTVIA